MLYEQYIKLGFKRTDTQDAVEFKQTGYHGFILNKQLNINCQISVCHHELDKPKMYISKENTCTCHVVQLTPDMVFDLFRNIPDLSYIDDIIENQKHINKGEVEKSVKFPVAVFANSKIEAYHLAQENGLNPDDENSCFLITKAEQINSKIFSGILVGDFGKMDAELIGAIMIASRTKIEK